MQTQKTLDKTKVFLATVFGILILNVPLRITNFSSSLITFPEMLFYIISLVVAFLSYSEKKTVFRYIILSIYLLAVSIASLTLYPYWFNYVDYGNFSKQLKKAEIVNDIRVLTNKKNEKILNGNGRILILDFWNSGCVACFEKFPVLQKLSDKYSGRVDFFAVNVPFKNENRLDILKKLPEIGYTFNTVILKDSLAYKELGVKVFPTTLLIDKDDKIIYRGDIESVEDVIRKLLN